MTFEGIGLMEWKLEKRVMCSFVVWKTAYPDSRISFWDIAMLFFLYVYCSLFLYGHHGSSLFCQFLQNPFCSLKKLFRK